MSPIRPLLFAAASAALLAAPALAGEPVAQSDEAKAERACFRIQNVNDWRYVDKSHVDVRAGVNDWYRLTVAGNARDLRFNQGLIIKGKGAGSFVCSGQAWPADLIAADAFGRPDHFAMRMAVREIAAIPKEMAGVAPEEPAEDAES